MEKQTLAEKAAEELIAQIREQGLRPGDRLPTEPELMQRLGVGRNTLREAIRLLSSRNVVTVRQGAGTYVSEKQGVADDPLGFDLAADRRKLTRDLLQIRSMLEPQIAALAAENASAADVEKLETVLAAMEERMERKEPFAELDSAFHAAIAECTGNRIMAKLIPVITEGVRTFAENVGEPEYTETLKSHRKILDAIRNRRAMEAQSEMQYHLAFNVRRYEE